MHIEFKKLILHNFISFGHSQLLFEDDGFIRVSGINQNPEDSATSNGSGKSSIWEGVIWALTGDTIRGTKQVGNLYGEDGTYVQLEFNIDNKHYDIIRSKDHKEFKTNLRITINGKDCSGKGIRESEKLLIQYLPDINASLLGSVIILGQGLPQKFTNNTPSGRKEVLEKLSKSDFMIEDLKTRVNVRRKELNDIIRHHEDEIVASTSKINLLKLQITNAQNTLNSMDKSKLEEELSNAQMEYDLLNSELTTLEELRQDLTHKVFESQTHLSTLQSEYENEKRSAETKYITLQFPIRERLVVLQTQSKAVIKQITEIENIKDICPTCGQKLVGVVKPDPSPFKIELDNINREIEEVTVKLSNLTSAQAEELKLINLKWIESISNSQRELDTISKNNKITADNILIKKRNLLNADNKLKSAQNSITQFDATKAGLIMTIENNSAEINDIEAQSLYNINERDVQQSHLEVINKFDTALKRDFRGFLLTTIINYIQDRAKEYCKVIFETDKIGFCLDGNNIDISYLDKAYENLSGGEKQKIDLIIQFSIRDMLCNHLGFTSNILVLDEVFDGLDMIGCQRVLDVISAISDIKNIFIVTHRKDLSIPSDKELIVVKSPNGISEIR